MSQKLQVMGQGVVPGCVRTLMLPESIQFVTADRLGEIERIDQEMSLMLS